MLTHAPRSDVRTRVHGHRVYGLRVLDCTVDAVGVHAAVRAVRVRHASHPVAGSASRRTGRTARRHGKHERHHHDCGAAAHDAAVCLGHCTRQCSELPGCAISAGRYVGLAQPALVDTNARPTRPCRSPAPIHSCSWIHPTRGTARRWQCLPRAPACRRVQQKQR